MPLKQSKSKAAFSSNVKAEMSAGKSQKQALAIAYAVKRKPKGYAKGGEVDEDMVSRPDKGWGAIIVKGKANGGLIEKDDEPASDTMVGDPEQFLSAEDAHNSPFQGQVTESDDQELSENDNQASDNSSNENGDADQSEDRAATLSDILKKVRMRNMGR